MNWIKDKWNKFKKTIVSILGIGVVLAAGSAVLPDNQPDTIVIYQDSKELMQEEKAKKYIALVRNFDGIQHETLRKEIDWKYNEAHDTLSQAYYEGLEFLWKGENYGILSKETFDKLHSMIWARYEIMFHEENLKQEKPYPEEEYNEIKNEDGNVIDTKYEKAKVKINEYQNENINIDL